MTIPKISPLATWMLAGWVKFRETTPKPHTRFIPMPRHKHARRNSVTPPGLSRRDRKALYQRIWRERNLERSREIVRNSMRRLRQNLRKD